MPHVPLSAYVSKLAQGVPAVGILWIFRVPNWLEHGERERGRKS